jgi:hypothetical protein
MVQWFAAALDGHGSVLGSGATLAACAISSAHDVAVRLEDGAWALDIGCAVAKAAVALAPIMAKPNAPLTTPFRARGQAVAAFNTALSFGYS